MLTAGTAPTPNGARDEKTGGFSANGVRPYQNNYLLDGVDNNSLSEDLVSDSSFVIGPRPTPSPNSKCRPTPMSAEFGRSGGAVLNVTIKSGSNAHGTANFCATAPWTLKTSSIRRTRKSRRSS